MFTSELGGGAEKACCSTFYFSDQQDCWIVGKVPSHGALFRWRGVLHRQLFLHEWAMLAGIGRQVLASGMDVA